MTSSRTVVAARADQRVAVYNALRKSRSCKKGSCVLLKKSRESLSTISVDPQVFLNLVGPPTPDDPKVVSYLKSEVSSKPAWSEVVSSSKTQGSIPAAPAFDAAFLAPV